MLGLIELTSLLSAKLPAALGHQIRFWQAALGLTAEQVDAMFCAGATL
jgi:hypothetical protein